MSYLILLLYAAALGAYAMHFARRDRAVGRAATLILLVAAVLHTVVIVTQTMAIRHEPISSNARTLSMFVWLLTLSYLYVETTTKERAMGAFILPIVVGLQTISTFSMEMTPPDPVLRSDWFWVHMASLMFAYASFGIAGVLGLIYVLQFKEIKKKQLGYFYTRLPSLQILDAMNSRAVAIGLLFLTVGVVAGIAWTQQARPDFPNNTNLAAMSLADPKVFIAALIWLVYSFSLLARTTMGWSGRRAAWLSAVGFAIVLLNLVPVTYFVPNSHTFNEPAAPRR